MFTGVVVVAQRFVRDVRRPRLRPSSRVVRRSSSLAGDLRLTLVASCTQKTWATVKHHHKCLARDRGKIGIRKNCREAWVGRGSLLTRAGQYFVVSFGKKAGRSLIPFWGYTIIFPKRGSDRPATRRKTCVKSLEGERGPRHGVREKQNLSGR